MSKLSPPKKYFGGGERFCGRGPSIEVKGGVWTGCPAADEKDDLQLQQMETAAASGVRWALDAGTPPGRLRRDAPHVRREPPPHPQGTGIQMLRRRPRARGVHQHLGALGVRPALPHAPSPRRHRPPPPDAGRRLLRRPSRGAKMMPAVGPRSGLLPRWQPECIALGPCQRQYCSIRRCWAYRTSTN